MIKIGPLEEPSVSFEWQLELNTPLIVEEEGSDLSPYGAIPGARCNGGTKSRMSPPSRVDTG